MRGTREEFSTIGFDPKLQGVGSGQDGSGMYVGLVVPETSTGLHLGVPTEPYVLMLANRRIGFNQRTRLVGCRQLVTMAAQVTNEDTDTVYNLEKVITSPTFRFQDGNVSWYVQRIPFSPLEPTNILNRSSYAENYSRSPAILYKTITYGGLAYTSAPIYGEPISPTLSNFHDLRFPWDSSQAWNSLDIEVEGPCDIALYAVVRQTDPLNRPTLVLPSPLPLAGPSGIPEDDAFVLNFPSAVYHRVAGSLIFEDPNMNALPRPDRKEP